MHKQIMKKGMQKAFGLWQTNETVEASNLFERIAGAESDNWLSTILRSTNKHHIKFW